MPLVFVVLALLAVMALAVLMLPLSIVLRYRAGTVRRMARGWTVTISFYAVTLSAAMFLFIAAAASVWIPGAFSVGVLGLLGGGALGLLGLFLTRWEVTPYSMHYTPSRWLILTITLLVAARLVYGFWRGWQAWRTIPGQESWLAASGAAGSMAAGAVVLGYYLVYWAGVRRRLTEYKRLTGKGLHAARR
ncbi:MAG TPA: hypothetical protein VNA04_00180 [Thermoanaerobaculia bacterium]|nr:hypothetical protein [Thermoanaerobaculia bacterium]